MKRITLRLLLAVALIATGWSIRLVQNMLDEPPGRFLLRIDSPSGSTTIRCEDGCKFVSWRNRPSPSTRQITFECDRPVCANAIGGETAGPLQMASNDIY